MRMIFGHPPLSPPAGSQPAFKELPFAGLPARRGRRACRVP